MFGLYHPALGVKISQDRKAELILYYKSPEIKTFVETGTHKGWMVDKLWQYFEKIYSIELDRDLYQRATEHFKQRENIELIQGDSAVELRIILDRVSKSILFWLDAHGNGAITRKNSPIIAEVEAIFAHPVKSHIILIDDARHFDLETIRMIKVMAKMNSYSFRINEGIFILTPRLTLK